MQENNPGFLPGRAGTLKNQKIKNMYLGALIVTRKTPCHGSFMT
jgi:hypothetical protein